MRTPWTASLSVATVCVLTLAGMATAQDDGTEAEIDVLAPAVVTGVGTPVRVNQTSEAVSAEPPLTAATANWGWTMMMESDDPRLTGTYETNQNVSRYGSGVALRSGVGRLTNEGGAWAAEFYGYTPGYGNAYVNYLTGEGGYAGLYAMLWMEPSASTHAFTGVIAPGPWPEPPEWVLPPAE